MKDNHGILKFCLAALTFWVSSLIALFLFCVLCMTVSPFEIISLPSTGTNLLANSRTVFELMLKSCSVAIVIATSFMSLNASSRGMFIFVNELIKFCTLSSASNMNIKQEVSWGVNCGITCLEIN